VQPLLGGDPLFPHKGLVINPWMRILYNHCKDLIMGWPNCTKDCTNLLLVGGLLFCQNLKQHVFFVPFFLTNMHNYVSAFWICTTHGSKFPAMFCIHILNTHKTHQQNTDPLCEISNNHKKCCFHRIARITNDQSQPPTNASLTIYIYKYIFTYIYINTYLHIYIYIHIYT